MPDTRTMSPETAAIHGQKVASTPETRSATASCPAIPVWSVTTDSTVATPGATATGAQIQTSAAPRIAASNDSTSRATLPVRASAKLSASVASASGCRSARTSDPAASSATPATSVRAQTCVDAMSAMAPPTRIDTTTVGLPRRAAQLARSSVTANPPRRVPRAGSSRLRRSTCGCRCGMRPPPARPPAG